MEASTSSLLIKDVHEIHARLFNHHPAISAEIKYFIKELSDERTEADVKSFLSLYETVKEVSEMEIDKIKSRSAHNFPEVISGLDRALKTGEKVLEQSEEFHNTCEKSLIESRQSRLQNWTDFMVDVSKRKEEIDQVWDGKNNDLKSHYRSLEEKL